MPKALAVNGHKRNGNVRHKNWRSAKKLVQFWVDPEVYETAGTMAIKQGYIGIAPLARKLLVDAIAKSVVRR